VQNQRCSALSWREAGVVFAAFLAASLLLTLPLAVRPSRALPSDLVDTLLNAWIIGWDADRLRHALRGLWDAPIFFPYRNTFAFSENLLGIAWLVAPAYWMSGNAVLAYNLAFWLSFTIAGLGMYLLVRDLADSRAAAIVAAAFYAFCPFRFAQIAHIQMVATGWLPLALWALHRYFATWRRRWLAFAVGFAGLQALSNTYVAFFMAVPLAAAGIAGLASARERLRRASIDLVCAGAALALLLAPVAAAYYRARADYDQVRTQDEIARGGADVRAYLIAVNGVWRPLLPEAGLGDIEKQLFPGFVAPLLAAAAIWITWRRRNDRGRAVWLYTAIALAGFLCSLGPHVRVWGTLVTAHGPYEWLEYLLPGMTGMRVPARFAIVCMLGLAVLAGCGAGLLVPRLPSRVRSIAVAVIVLLLVAESWSLPMSVVRYPGSGRPEDRAAADWLLAAAPGPVLHLPLDTNNFQELNYQYATLRHGHPIVNGFSGYGTPLQDLLRDPRSPMYDFERFAATVRMLRRFGVRYVVLHERDYSPAALAAGEPGRTAAALRASGQLRGDQRLPGIQIFELGPWPDESSPVVSTRIPAGEFTLSASEEPERVASIVDGDPDSRWIGRQDGTSWVGVHFKHARDVAQVELSLAGRSRTDVPRELQIDSTDDAGTTRVLYRSTPYPEFIAGFLANAAYPRMTIVLPSNHSARLTIREVASYPGWWWSIHELGLRERAGAP
jgi:hypothetical protein